MTQVAGELERAAGSFTPGPLPVVIVSGSGPVTTGQTPTLSPGQPAAGDSRDRSGPQSSTQAAEAASGPRRSGWGLWLGLFGLLGLSLGGAFTAQQLGLVKLPVALPAALTRLWHTPPPPPPPVKLVRWTLSSEPAGAEVLDKTSRSVLGTTPWFREQPSAPGKQALIVRAAGHLDAEIELDQAQDSSPHIRLLAGGDLGASVVADGGSAAISPGQAPTPTAADLGSSPTARTPPATPTATPTVKPGPASGTPPLRPAQPGGPKKRPNTPGGGNLRDEDLPTSLPED